MVRRRAAARAHHPLANPAFVFPEMLMITEAIVSLGIGALVIARAINILA